MVNWNVGYVRPARSLTTLRDELDEIWPNRQPDLGFITGYKSATNYTGHNPNERGIVMAYDIGTYINGDIDEPDGRWLADYLRTQCSDRFYYLIHDMAPTYPPKPMIASNNTDFEWVPYSGTAAHSNHIHLSIMDEYWGEPGKPAAPASVYDSTASWGVKRAYEAYKAGHSLGGSITPITPDKPAADDITPITKDWFDMATQNDLRKEIARYVGDVVEVPGNIGSADYRKGNPTWAVKNALTSIWRYGKDCRDMLRIVQEVPVPSNQGSAESRKGNPKWYLPNALRNIWSGVNNAQANSAATLEIVKELAQHPDGLTAEQVEAAAQRGVRTALEDGTVEVIVKGDIK